MHLRNAKRAFEQRRSFFYTISNPVDSLFVVNNSLAPVSTAFANQAGMSHTELEFGKFLESYNSLMVQWEKPELARTAVLKEENRDSYSNVNVETSKVATELVSARSINEPDLINEQVLAELKQFIVDKLESSSSDSPVILYNKGSLLLESVKNPPIYSGKNTKRLGEIRREWLKDLTNSVNYLESALTNGLAEFDVEASRELLLNIFLNLMTAYRERGLLNKMLAKENISDEVECKNTFDLAWKDMNIALSMNQYILDGDKTGVPDTMLPLLKELRPTLLGGGVIGDARTMRVIKKSKEDLLINVMVERVYSNLTFFEDTARYNYDQGFRHLRQAEDNLKKLFTDVKITSLKRGEWVLFKAGEAHLLNQLLIIRLNSKYFDSNKAKSMNRLPMQKILYIGALLSGIDPQRLPEKFMEGFNPDADVPAAFIEKIHDDKDQTLNLLSDVQKIYPQLQIKMLRTFNNMLSWYESDQFGPKEALDDLRSLTIDRLSLHYPEASFIYDSRAELDLFGNERNTREAYNQYKLAYDLSGSNEQQSEYYQLGMAISESFSGNNAVSTNKFQDLIAKSQNLSEYYRGLLKRLREFVDRFDYPIVRMESRKRALRTVIAYFSALQFRIISLNNDYRNLNPAPRQANLKELLQEYVSIKKLVYTLKASGGALNSPDIVKPDDNNRIVENFILMYPVELFGIENQEVSFLKPQDFLEKEAMGPILREYNFVARGK